ncbi:MAG: RHS repeat-associated core domain-containing protein, partial [Candidatus Cloacimonetes bacterium]|nr:RHS repeat-associated core domain-containing protein [Candidatus Cloacimonadota bacterium]
HNAFGETKFSGAMKDQFTHWFSTKPFDKETGFVVYQRRYYDPLLCRWLSRDPVGIKGGLNEFGFLENDGVNQWDIVGLYSTSKKSFKKCIKWEGLIWYIKHPITLNSNYRGIKFGNFGSNRRVTYKHDLKRNGKEYVPYAIEIKAKVNTDLIPDPKRSMILGNQKKDDCDCRFYKSDNQKLGDPLRYEPVVRFQYLSDIERSNLVSLGWAYDSQWYNVWSVGKTLMSKPPFWLKWTKGSDECTLNSYGDINETVRFRARDDFFNGVGIRVDAKIISGNNEEFVAQNFQFKFED